MIEFQDQQMLFCGKGPTNDGTITTRQQHYFTVSRINELNLLGAKHSRDRRLTDVKEPNIFNQLVMWNRTHVFFDSWCLMSLH